MTQFRTAKDLLDFLANRRRFLGIDASALATSANVSPKFISQLENGKESVEVDSLAKVAHALGLNIPLVNDAEYLGRLIREQRHSLELDQIMGASLCNVSPRFLSTIENGKRKKRLNKLFDVLHGFGVIMEVIDD